MLSVGIDLGTTNSAVAVYDGKTSKVLRTRMNEPLIPSVVGYKHSKKNKDGEILVGRVAVNNALIASKETVFSIKRLMGRTYDDAKIQELKGEVGFQIVSSSEEEKRGVFVKLNNKEYSPVEISAMILKEIKSYAEYRLSKEVTHAVITVPAYFEERQRAATREAGIKAGFIVKMIISEPVAAAIAFGADSVKDEGRRILVFDLGGGTFDISIIQMCGDQFQVMAHEGNNWLGGDDFDREIVEAIVEHVKKEEGFDPSNDSGFRFKAKQKAQEAKIALSGSDEFEIILNPAGETPDGNPFIVEMIITRNDFEKMIIKHVDQCIELTRKALIAQELANEDLSEVLLVGGSTAVPLIESQLKDEFKGIPIKSDIDPMECVALGAAILATKLKGIECPSCFEDEENEIHTVNDESALECKSCGYALSAARAVGDMDYYDVTAVHLGIKAVKGDNLNTFAHIIEKGTEFPLKEPMKETFYTSEDNQKLIRIPVFEGMHDLADQNDLQGVVEWNLPEGLKISTPVEVAFNYDRFRTLTVSVRVKERDDLSHEVTLQRDNPPEIMSTTMQGEVDTDDDWREDADLTNTANSFLSAFENYMSPGTPEKMHNSIEKLETALEENNEVVGRNAANDIYKIMISGAGVASQLYLAERATDGAAPDIAHEIHEVSEDLRNAYLNKDDQDTIKPIANKLKMLVTRQLQERMARQNISENVNYEQLLKIRD